MDFNITQIRKDLALAGAQLVVFRASFKDGGDDEQAAILDGIIKAVTNAGEFFINLEDDDFEYDEE